VNPRRPEMADIVRTHHPDLLARWNHVLSREQRKALCDIRDCRSAALGGRVQQCDRCGHRVILYNSCRNRHCPKCQAQARARWLAQRESELLPVPYFHVVFTLPVQIGRLALQNPRQIYAILFRSASQTLLNAAADPRLLGASIGFLTVLHTWGQNLHLHPHLHCVVPGGGISLDGTRWIGCRKSSFFLPVRLLSHRFRKSFLRSLRHAFRNGTLHFQGELKAREAHLPPSFREGLADVRVAGDVPWKVVWTIRQQNAGTVDHIPGKVHMPRYPDLKACGDVDSLIVIEIAICFGTVCPVVGTRCGPRRSRR